MTNSTYSTQPDVQAFIGKMVKKHGFKASELAALFNSIKIRPRILQSVKAPLEQKPWYAYQLLFINQSHIKEGVKFWAANEEALARAEKTFGVPASIIVATIGVETRYGKNRGEYPVIEALSNIAFSNSPRAGYFRTELEEFLLLAREQHLDPKKIKGSYAGAIGQPQFMPSSYRRYAVNFSGNAQIDLYDNNADIIASVANYYKQHGWQYNQPVAIPALLKQNLIQYFTQNTLPTTLPADELRNYGVFPTKSIISDEDVRLIVLKNYYQNEYWIGLHNFEVIRRYNPSNLYAMAVYQLSDYITALKGRLHT